MKRTIRLSGIVLGVAILVLLSGCPDLFTADLDSPMDPDADSYQGYETTDDPNDVQLHSNRGDGIVFLSPFVLTKVNGADRYHIQVATSAAFAADTVVYQRDDATSNIINAVTDLNPGTTYYWRGRAHHGSWGSYTAVVSFSMADPLSYPSPDDGTTVADTTPSLSWDAVDGAASYEVQIADSEAGVADATAVEVTSAEHTPMGALTNNATHWWRVRAVDADGQRTAWSTTMSLTVSWAAMTNLSPADGETVSDTTPSLSWDAVDGAASYEVQIADSEAGVADATAVAVSEAEYTPSEALENNATHYWRVRAVDADGQGTAWSTTTSLTVSWGAMTGLSPSDASTVADTTPTLSWDTVDGAEKYAVQVANSESEVESATAEEVTSAEYTPTSALTNNATHYWRVRAVDADGQRTAWSATTRLTVSWGEMTGLNPSDGSTVADTTPTLSWDAVDKAVRYEVHLADDEAGVEAATAEEVTSAEYTPSSGLAKNSNYYWRVRAVDADGQGTAWSDTIQFNIPETWIGDTGPAGGIVFYDKGSDTDGWRYLEAAPSDIDVSGDYTHAWGGYGTSVGSTGTDIGTGAANTTAIVTAYGSSDPYNNTGDYAARLADRYEYGGYDDWFLPSKEELNLMYNNKEYFGVESGNYWSSSEYTSTHVWYRYLHTDHQSNEGHKSNEFRVRPVRRF